MDTQQQKKFTVLLIGDSCIDEYHFGTVDRISPEAPVPVFKLTKKISKPGMAANVKENLLMLGLDVCFVTKGNSTKIRLIDAKSKQHIVRVDDDIKSDPLTINEISIDLRNIDAIVVSDYNKGLVTYDLVKSIRKKYSGPIFIDTKKHDLKEFEGCVVKINETEFSKANSITSSLIVTQGNKGCTYNGVQFSVRETEVVDVTGCGDTFLAALVYMFLETNDIIKAIEFANKAASVTVQHLGVYAPKLEEIK